MSNDLKLYEITQEMEALDSILEKDKGEITDEYVELLNDVTMLMRDKTDACVGYYKREEDLIKLAKQRISELRDFIQIREKKLGNFKSYVKFCLEKMNVKSFRGVLNEIKLRKPLDVLNIVDDSKIPPEFITVETITKIDKKALKNAIKNGLEVAGVEVKKGEPGVMMGLKKGK
jgi:hypothetical protein